MSIILQKNTVHKIGKVCGKHPELKGLRYISNSRCTTCMRRYNKDVAADKPKKEAKKENKVDVAALDRYLQLPSCSFGK
jgi:hypothetical protein